MKIKVKGKKGNLMSFIIMIIVLILFFSGVDVGLISAIFGVGIFGVAIGLIIYMSYSNGRSALKSAEKMESLRKNNLSKNLKLEGIYAGNYKLLIICTGEMNGSLYRFLTVFSGMASELVQKVQTKSIDTIRALVDEKDPSVYELDMLDLFSKVECICSLDHDSSFATSNLDESYRKEIVIKKDMCID